MNQSDWTELKQIFAEACELGPEERSALLERRCAGKPGLRAEVEEYLRHHAQLARRPPRPSSAPIGELAGTRIGRYCLVERIGEGGFGTVWLAEQEEPLKRLVALKLLKPGMDSKAVLARFDVERQALALMDHPGIARILDGGATEQGRPYFVMELVRGLPITRYCTEHGSSTAERLALFREVCLAVQHAHQKGVIHRDIKPSNVLVTEQDGRPQPKVIDFGVAKATGVRLTESTLATGIDQLIGTPDYMAPEQAAPGGADIDTRADVYALGVLLYELLTGTRPFDMRALLAQGLEELLRTLREVDPERPSLRKPALERDLDWLVLRALEKDRGQRYPTAQDFADDITHFLRNEPLSAGPPSAIYRLRKFVRRNRLGVAAVCAVGLALLAGTITTWRGYYVAEQGRVLAEQKSTEADEQRSEALRLAEREKQQREIAVAKEAEARRELSRSTFFIKLLFDMLGSADPHTSRNPEMKVREMLEQFEAELAPRLAQEPDVRIGALLVLAHAWLGIGNADRARANLEIARPELVDHPDVDAGVSLLELEAQCRHAEQDWSGAIEFERQAIGKREALARPEDQLAVLEERAFLADLLCHSGELVEAESVVRSLILELEARVPRAAGTEFSAQLTLSKILMATGRASEAEDLLRSTFESAPTEALEESSASLNLAAALLQQGRFAEGEELLRDAEPRLRARLGDSHPEYGRLQMQLGVALLGLRRLAEAETADRKSLEIARAHAPAGSPALVGPLSELGTVLYAQGRASESVTFAQEALRIRRLNNPEEAPDLARCAENLAAALVSLSRFEEALPFCVESIEARRSALPASRDDLDFGLLVYAGALLELGRFETAEKALRERMQLYASAEEDNPEQRALALSALGDALVGLERWTEADSCLREAIQILGTRFKPGNWALETSRSLLGVALVGEGRQSEGGELLRSAAKLIEPTRLQQQRKRDALQRLKRFLEASGQAVEAAEVQTQIEQLQQSAPGGSPR